MDIIDLSHTITPGMTVFPGSEGPCLEQTSDLERHGFAEKKITLYSHHGTHVDAPAHVLPDGAHLDDLAADQFIGEALCIASAGPVIGRQTLLPYLADLQSVDFLLIATGWSRFWGDPSYLLSYPVLDEACARLLCGLRLKGVGLDTISADAPHAYDLPIHRILLRHMLVVENLANLEGLIGRRFLFSCLPLKIAKADGAPVRAVAMAGG